MRYNQLTVTYKQGSGTIVLATGLAYRNHRNTAIKNRNESLLHAAFLDKVFFLLWSMSEKRRHETIAEGFNTPAP